MANDCLVTKLKGTVNNNSLRKMNEIRIQFLFPDATQNYALGDVATFGLSVGDEIARIAGNGSFIVNGVSVGKSLTWTSGKYTNVMVSGDTEYLFISKASTLNEINIDCAYSVGLSLDEFSYAGGLTSLSLRNYSNEANIDLIKGDTVTTLQNINITGEGVLTGNINRFTSATTIIGTYITLYGDLSLLNNLIQVANNSGTFLYSSTRDASAKIVTCYGRANFGNALDAYLIDQARLIPNSNISNYRYHDMQVAGTRTSASDSAVAALKTFGFTVKVNNEVL